MKKRPNIVIFNPDQFRADALHHLGINSAASTPFLDDFAANEAVSFRYAYCQNPVCSPSRCSFFTGLYPHVNGHRTMQHLLHSHESSMFTELMAAGYYVWMNDRNDLVAGQIPGLIEKHADEIYSATSDAVPGVPENPDPRGNPSSKNYYSHYVGKLLPRDGRHVYHKDDAAVDAALARMEHPVDGRPQCLFLGLLYPHPDYEVEEPYFSMIDRNKLPRRAGIGTGKPLMQEELRKRMGMQEYTEADWNEMRAVYLGMVRKIDDNFRRLCEEMKKNGTYDNSLIIVLSDHGDFGGNYDLPEKAQNTFEDCLTRVPLLIKPPKDSPVDPGITDSIAELVDFYATVMDYAGVEPDHNHFGKSLRPVVENRAVPNRTYAFCEGGRLPHETQCDEYHGVCGPGSYISPATAYWPKQSAQTVDEAHCKGTMITDTHYKYVLRSTGADEFYDLKKDPLEETNEIRNPDYSDIIPQYRSAMLEWYQKTCDIVPKKGDSRIKYSKMRSLLEGLPKEIDDAAMDLYLEGTGGAIIGMEIRRLIREYNASHGTDIDPGRIPNGPLM